MTPLWGELAGFTTPACAVPYPSSSCGPAPAGELAADFGAQGHDIFGLSLPVCLTDTRDGWSEFHGTRWVCVVSVSFSLENLVQTGT